MYCTLPPLPVEGEGQTLCFVASLDCVSALFSCLSYYSFSLVLYINQSVFPSF